MSLKYHGKAKHGRKLHIYHCEGCQRQLDRENRLLYRDRPAKVKKNLSGKHKDWTGDDHERGFREENRETPRYFHSPLIQEVCILSCYEDSKRMYAPEFPGPSTCLEHIGWVGHSGKMIKIWKFTFCSKVFSGRKTGSRK